MSLLFVYKTYKKKLETQCPQHLGLDVLYNFLKCQGHEYKKNAGVITEVEHDLPVVGNIEDIYFLNEDKVLFDLRLYTTHYDSHFRAYVLHKTAQRKLLYLPDLKY